MHGFIPAHAGGQQGEGVGIPRASEFVAQLIWRAVPGEWKWALTLKQGANLRHGWYRLDSASKILFGNFEGVRKGGVQVPGRLLTPRISMLASIQTSWLAWGVALGVALVRQ